MHISHRLLYIRHCRLYNIHCRVYMQWVGLPPLLRRQWLLDISDACTSSCPSLAFDLGTEDQLHSYKSGELSEKKISVASVMLAPPFVLSCLSSSCSWTLVFLLLLLHLSCLSTSSCLSLGLSWYLSSWSRASAEDHLWSYKWGLWSEKDLNSKAQNFHNFCQQTFNTG